MALTTLQGTSRMYYPFDLRVLRETTFTPLTLDATGEKVAFGGRVFFHERIAEQDENPFTKNISAVWFRFGTVVKSGGSGLTVSLQSMDGFPAADQPKPDETQDQTGAITNGNADFASDNWIRVALSTVRAVSFSEKLCVVIEFDGSGRLSSDSVEIDARTCETADRIWTPWASIRSAAGTWSVVAHWPMVALEFDDGSMGTLEGSYVSDGFGEHLIESSSSPDEYGLSFTMPWQCSVDAIIVYGGPNNSESNYELLIYSNTTVVATITVDGDTVGLDYEIGEFTLDQEYTLNAGTSYILAMRPTLTNQVRLGYESIADPSHLFLWGDDNLGQVSRTDQGSWGALDQTKLPLLGVRISAFHDDEV